MPRHEEKTSEQGDEGSQGDHAPAHDPLNKGIPNPGSRQIVVQNVSRAY